MSDSGIDAQARLQAWREQGAQHVDPVRFARIDALAQRTAVQRGAVRTLLDARLAELFDAYAADMERMPVSAVCGDASSTGQEPAGSAMAALLEHLRREVASRDDRTADVPADTRIAVAGEASGDRPANALAGTACVRDMLDDVRRASALARTESQMRQALQDAPENAGPLNSTNLVHRALNAMREAAPGYLLPFMAYVDTLAWLEGMGLHDAQAAPAAPASTSGGKRSRGKPRSRRA